MFVIGFTPDTHSRSPGPLLYNVTANYVNQPTATDEAVLTPHLRVVC